MQSDSKTDGKTADAIGEETQKSKTKVVIIPGNGDGDIHDANWYGWLEKKLMKQGVTVVMENMPDPLRARREQWIPFIRHSLFADQDTVLVGHSSGAMAALRFAEMYRLKAVVLVAACYTDLSNKNEREAHWYPNYDRTENGKNPYHFDKMLENCNQWYQFHSDDDPFIPIKGEADKIRDNLRLKEGENCFFLKGRSHFFNPSDCRELLEVVLKVSKD